MNGLLHYFAYGSNLHPARMTARVPSAQAVGCALLPGHRLRFHKRSLVDGSAKCDAHYTGRPEDRVYGVVYRLDGREKAHLDAVEGPGYAVIEQQVIQDGVRLPVFFYRARPDSVAEKLAPYDWYHALVVHGARHHGLPASYLAQIEAVRARPDPDAARAAAARAQLDALLTVSASD